MRNVTPHQLFIMPMCLGTRAPFQSNSKRSRVTLEIAHSYPQLSGFLFWHTHTGALLIFRIGRCSVAKMKVIIRGESHARFESVKWPLYSRMRIDRHIPGTYWPRTPLEFRSSIFFRPCRKFPDSGGDCIKIFFPSRYRYNLRETRESIPTHVLVKNQTKRIRPIT